MLNCVRPECAVTTGRFGNAAEVATPATLTNLRDVVPTAWGGASGMGRGGAQSAMLSSRCPDDYEGDHHRVPPLQDADWHHTRLSAADLADPRYILARTRGVLLERGWTP